MADTKPQFEFHPLSVEEIKSFSIEMDALLDKYSAEMIVVPMIKPDGRLSAEAQVLKKVEKSIPSPFMQSNGSEPTTNNPDSGSAPVPAV